MTNEKAEALESNGSNKLTRTKQMNLTIKTLNFQAAKMPSITVKISNGQNAARPRFDLIGMRFVCDECCAPLHIYGANFIESYKNGRANIMRCLCDLHFEEFEMEVTA